MSKKTFKIPVTWKSWGVMKIEANSLEEAEDLALGDFPIPCDSEYVEDSIELDIDSFQYGDTVEYL